MLRGGNITSEVLSELKNKWVNVTEDSYPRQGREIGFHGYKIYEAL